MSHKLCAKVQMSYITLQTFDKVQAKLIKPQSFNPDDAF